ncbi:type IV toxin-antitoxin system AbiEi family antitoxin [Microbacterium sp. B2969]|uniref:Type IV toxin-antitoxin system AbiEi family antitoxin n=1 Tax=Microbacterium alkaliflavum TaxID=3248839 RepID=A0ABW7Q4S9_9MICO
MTSPFLYFPGDRLSPAELSAARLDGDVVELGEAYIPADAVETRGLRAGSLRGILGDHLAATHLSAAWVHGGLEEPPTRHTVQRAVPWRLHQVIGRRVVYRDPSIPPEDLLPIGGVLVTSPRRTLADLARVPDDDYADAARRLADVVPGLALDAVGWFEERGPVPHKRSAVAFLRGLAAREPVAPVRTT